MSSSSSSSALPPKRYILNAVDFQHFLQSPTKHALWQTTQAMGKACASLTTVSPNNHTELPLYYEYNPQQPLLGLTPALAVLHGALRGIQTWIEVDFPVNNNNNNSSQTSQQQRFGNPLFRKWHDQLVQRSPTIIQTMLQAHRQYSTIHTTDESWKMMAAAEPQYDMDMLQTCSQQGYTAATTTHVVMDHDSKTSMKEDDDTRIVTELACYFNAAFGHAIRLDYGSGHECSFHVFLYCCCVKLGLYNNNNNNNTNNLKTNETDTEAVSDTTTTTTKPPSLYRLKACTLSIWTAYLQVTRPLQTLYMLEPAGSHGVWGLDDYHCLPFYFGACQLQAYATSITTNMDNPLPCPLDDENASRLSSPSCIHEPTILQEGSDTYLYLGCIRYIQSLKKNVPFFESSPMLNDISHLPSWSKLANGLLKLFDGEVLSKRPVVQHFCFGKLFEANWTPTGEEPQAPTHTFATNVAPMVRAPWATNEEEQIDDADRTTMPPPTRAPWAK